MEKAKFVMQMPPHSYEHVPEKERGVAITKAQPLPQTEIVGNAGKLLDRYRQSYKARYRQDAVILDVDSASATMKEIITSVGLTKALALVDHFLLSMDGSTCWFLKEGHSVAILQRRIEEVNASLSVKEKRQGPVSANYNPMVVFETQCPNCQGNHAVTCKGSEMGMHAHTRLCDACVQRWE